MVGTAKKNENSAAKLRVNRCCIPPIIDAALRLTPGIMAIHCHKPIIKALPKPIRSSSLTIGCVKNLFTNSKTIPPSNKLMATVRGLSNKTSILSLNTKPKTRAGITATTSFI